MFEVLAEAVRFADELEYVGTVGKPIEKRSGKAFISEDLRPVCEAKVRRDDHGDAFVERRAELKDEMRTGRRKGDEAEFVEDDQVLLNDGGEELCKAVFVLGLHEMPAREAEAALESLRARRLIRVVRKNTDGGECELLIELRPDAFQELGVKPASKLGVIASSSEIEWRRESEELQLPPGVAV